MATPLFKDKKPVLGAMMHPLRFHIGVFLCCVAGLFLIKSNPQQQAFNIPESVATSSPKPSIEHPSRAKLCSPRKTLAEIDADRLSQQDEDIDLFHFFNGVCEGTYIEMGAVNGLKYSNTYVFNKHLGYRGLLIELNPTNHKQAVINRPNELAVVNAAVCSEKADLHWVDGVPGQINGIWEFASEKYRRKWWSAVTDVSQLAVVKCQPMKDILEEHLRSNPQVAYEKNGETHYYFDFYSLDVEGAEWSVLQSIDWKHISFGILFLERKDGDIESQQQIIRFLTEQQGYRLIPKSENQSRGSDWFKHPQFQEIYRLS